MNAMEKITVDSTKNAKAIIFILVTIFIGAFMGSMAGGYINVSGNNTEWPIVLLGELPPCPKDWEPNSSGLTIVTCTETKNSSGE